jgi:hypothetical protein
MPSRCRSFYTVYGMLAWLAIGFAGCGSQAPSFPVRGTVTLDGQPMATGEIHFKIPAKGSIEPITVRSGSFQGAVARSGSYVVEVYSFRKPNLSAEDLAKLDPVARVTAGEQKNIVADGLRLSAEVKSEGVNAYSFSVTSVTP